MKNYIAGLAAVLMLSGSAFASSPNLQPDPRYIAAYSPAPGETAFDFKLKGYVFGIKMINARYKGQFDSQNYMAYSDLKTAGLGALLKKLRIWAITEGRCATRNKILIRKADGSRWLMIMRPEMSA
jgi:hypothetical protein